MPHVLPPLPYPYEALEPHIDAQTMRLHHDIHHKGYVDGLNAAEEKLAKARESGDFAAVQALQRQVAFHGSGHFNHVVFWENMGPKGGGTPSGDLAARITKDFGGFDKFKAHFSQAATTVGHGFPSLSPTSSSAGTGGRPTGRSAPPCGARTRPAPREDPALSPQDMASRAIRPAISKI